MQKFTKINKISGIYNKKQNEIRIDYEYRSKLHYLKFQEFFKK